jgi:hypothetical protein
MGKEPANPKQRIFTIRKVDCQERLRKMGIALFSPASQDSRWKGDDRFEKVEDGVDRDAEESKGQREEPDDGVQDERQQGQRPAEN